jgi:UDP-glucose 4-epimerase
MDVYLRDNKRINESSQTLISNEYTKTKLNIEGMLQDYCNKNRIALQILRIGHIYGEGDFVYKKLIPTIFNAIVNDKIMQLTSDLNQKVNLLYIRDFLEIIYEILNKDNIEGISNIVSSHPVSLQSIIDSIEVISNKKLMINQKCTKLDNSIYDFEPSNLLHKLTYNETSIFDGLLESFKLYRGDFYESIY